MPGNGGSNEPQAQRRLGSVQEEKDPFIPFDHPALPNRFTQEHQEHVNTVLTWPLHVLGYRRGICHALKTTQLPAGALYISHGTTQKHKQGGILLTLAMSAIAFVTGKALACELGFIFAGR